jgi:aspartate racemase
MKIENNNTIGIVGGMGPEAGAALFSRILYYTEAATDQEHLPVILMSFPNHLVDRTSFLEGRTKINPAYNVAKIIGKLETAGANIIGIACNTSHVPEIYRVIEHELNRTDSRVKLIHMPFETCQRIREHYPHVRRIGIMSTNGTYKAGIYEKFLLEWGYEVIVPDPAFQDNIIHKMIYDPEFGIKANPNAINREVRSLMKRSVEFFKKKKADGIILGCTELSALAGIYKEKTMPVIIDSIDALAQALIRETIHVQTTKKHNDGKICGPAFSGERQTGI